MTTPVRPQQHHLSWPLTAAQVEGMEDMFVTLFKRLRAVEVASSSAAVDTGDFVNEKIGEIVGRLPEAGDRESDVIPGIPYHVPNSINVGWTQGSLIYAGPSSRLANAGITTNTAGTDLIIPSISAPTTPAAGTGVVYANTTNGHTFLHYMDEGGSDLVLERDNVILVRNTSGGSLTKGTAVNIYGATGQVPNVRPSDNTDITKHTEGLLQETIANNGFGLCIVQGYVQNIDTSAFVDGNVLYTGTAGAVVATAPSFPTAKFQQRIGVVVYAHATQGIIQVELSGVKTLVTLTSDVTGILPYANGGTNASTAWTQGSVIFAGASAFAQDNANFFWDATNHFLGIGTTPTQVVHLQTPGTTPCVIKFGVGTFDNYFGAAGSANSIITGSVTNDITIRGSNRAIILSTDAGTTPHVYVQATSGKVGIGNTSPTAILHLNSGSASAGFAPLKFTSGTLLTSPEAGAMEFNTDTLSFTITTGIARKTIAFTDSTMTGLWNGTKIGLAYGGTNADLSGTGGTSQVLKQTAVGAAVTVGQLALADLSNYTTGSWTPAITFATPGDLSVTYSIQQGHYIQIGKFIHVTFILVTSAFTFTTASGLLQITGLPFTPKNTVNYFQFNGGLEWQGITKAGYTHVYPVISPNTTTFGLNASGSGQVVANISAGDVPSGGSVNFSGVCCYEAN